MKKILTFLVLIIMGFTTIIMVTSAEESEEAAEESDSVSDTSTFSPADVTCASTVASTASVELDNYINFLDQYFKIDSPSSEQVETGMARYRYFVDAVETAFETASAPLETETFETNQKSYTYCREIETQYLNFGRKLLSVFSLQAGNSKRTYALVDTLKAINEQMSGLSDNFSHSFPQLFQKMDDALPCYAKKCLFK